MVIDLLFILATWHAYAKLRLHTEHTLESMEGATSALGAAVRHFVRVTSAEFKTFDLPREEAARARRQKDVSTDARSSQKTGGSGRKERKLNLSTYKYHRLGDYVESIRRFGTADNYTTQTVSY
jgi:hypothetical protein